MIAAENKAVFLSYASQDATAVARLAEALRAAGVEVWFDLNELQGGDAWDAKIRRQIAECALFVPVISANTQARREGYFRIEWRLAAQRTHAMADGTTFLLPVVIDDTRDADALVPAEFKSVQWTRLPGGDTPTAFGDRVGRMLTSEANDTKGNTRHERVRKDDPPPLARRHRNRPALLVAAGIIGGLGVAAWIWRQAITAAPPPAIAPTLESATTASSLPPAALDPKSVAVLAFANMSADKDNEYFSDGLSENILDKLARVPGLRVMARTSSFSYKGKNAPASQIAAELRVGTIIDGSVQRAGQRLRVVARLINAADGVQFWSDTFDRELTTADIFAVQDEIAARIALRLDSGTKASQMTETRPTSNLAAYDLFLRGQALLAKNAIDSALDAARLFEHATKLDPGFALAFARAGWARARLYWSGGLDAENQYEPASRAIAEALRLQPDLPQAHLAQAVLLSAEGNQLDAVGRAIDLAEAGRPATADTLAARGQWLRDLGRLPESSEMFRRSVGLDPQNTSSVNSYGLSLYFLGRYAEAIATFDQALQLGGSSVSATNRINTMISWKGAPSEAVRFFHSVPDERWSTVSREFLSHYLQVPGYYDLALQQADRIEPVEFLGQLGYVIRSAATARVRAAMGDDDGARRDYLDALPRAEAYRDRHPESWRAYVTLARIYTGLGQKADALAAARKCVELLPADVNPYYAQRVSLRVLANALARFGELDEALALVRAQIEKGWWRRNQLLLHADFYELRKHPRFRALAEAAPL